MTKYYKVHQKKHPEHYEKIKEKWEEFEHEYWRKHPELKFCHACGEKHRVELHHIIPRHIDPSRIFDESNLIPLCRACHFRIGHLLNWDNYNPYVVEDARNIYRLIISRRGIVKKFK